MAAWCRQGSAQMLQQSFQLVPFPFQVLSIAEYQRRTERWGHWTVLYHLVPAQLRFFMEERVETSLVFPPLTWYIVQAGQMSSANDPPSPAFYFPTCCVDAKFVVLNCVFAEGFAVGWLQNTHVKWKNCRNLSCSAILRQLVVQDRKELFPEDIH